jgi:hypothetical protein
MYKSDPNQPKPNLSSDNTSKGDTKVEQLELKIKELTERLSQQQEIINKMNRIIRRQGTDISNLASAINRNR